MVFAEYAVVVGIGLDRNAVVLAELVRRTAAAAVVDRLLVVVRNVGVLLILAFVAFYLVPLGTHGLWIPDESRYAQIGQQILIDGNYFLV